MPKTFFYCLRLLPALFVLSTMTGCAGIQTTRKLENPEYVIMTADKAVTPIGKEFASAHQDDLRRIFDLIRARYNSNYANFIVQDGSYALGIYPEKPGSNVIYFGALILSGDLYNLNKTNFNQRAATSFTKHARKLMRDLTSEENILKDKNVKGIMLTLAWSANHFSGSGLDFIGADIEGIQIYSSIAGCKKLLNDEISNAEFIKKSKIIGFQKNQEIGRIDLDLKESL
jgi:hypothetical protein